MDDECPESSIVGPVPTRVETMLGRLFAQQPDDKQVLVDLYLRRLARQPEAGRDGDLSGVPGVGPKTGNRLRRHFVGARHSTEFLNRK